MDEVKPITGPVADPYAKAWGDLLRRERRRGHWIPDAPKLPDGSNRQVDFADFLGVSQGTYSAWERGEMVPSAYHQRRIVTRLRVAPDELWRLMHAGGDAA